MPAEWEMHRSVWLAWPSASHLWRENLEPAQDEFVGFAKAIADCDPSTGRARGEHLNILVPDVNAAAQVEKRFAGVPVTLHMIPFGDIWLRDTAPLFLKSVAGETATLEFRFNGWGGKYILPHDGEVAHGVSKASGYPAFESAWICEGGSLEVDGEGTCLTTRQCLLNPNRNPQLTQRELEQRICENLGVNKVLWLNEGLVNDHTDGHIDTIARFVGPGHVAIHQAMVQDDPNRGSYETIDRELQAMTDAKGRKFKITRVPSPGAVLDDEGQLMPASFLNFYIGNTTVIVPIYGTKWDGAAVEAIAACFPGRKTVGLSARAILTGGGAFHCISQQQPI
jgi:agmatine deiminase